MLMMCWFYCIPFAKGLFFASAPLILLFSLFVLKRGIRQSRLGLRQLAFVLMFIAIMKLFTVDIYLSRDTFLCAFDECHDTGLFKMLQAAGLAACSCSTSTAALYRNDGRYKPHLNRFI